ncbi:MAG: 50S ribosomal protein L30 [Spirochaetes bacterium]|nr:50S ribosomal protein L30 [Spirochaetota bacterium]
MSKQIVIKQIKSNIGTKPKQRATLKALGLRRLNAERTHEDSAVIKGMIDKVKHLVEVKELSK